MHLKRGQPLTFRWRPMVSGVLLVRATVAPGIGVNSLGAGFSCSSKGSRFRWRDSQTGL